VEITIRRLRRSDLDEAFFNPRGRTNYERWLEAQEREILHVAVAEVEDLPVGRVGLDLRTKALEGMAVLWAAHVEPDYQSKGIGTCLILHLEEVARERGFDAIHLAVGKTNPRAEALYRRLGYRRYGERSIAGATRRTERPSSSKTTAGA